MKTPNIFNYATSELSQDAFILWLLDWANPENVNSDKSLWETAQAFVRLLLDKEDLEVTSVKCKKQENHIDVFAIINNQYALIIEDKTNTSEHSNQIQRYYDWVKREKRYSNLEIHCVYYKTGNESAYKHKKLTQKYEDNFHAEHFTIISRKEVLDALSPFTTTNSIFRDYVSYIQNIQNNTDAYISLPIKDWDWQCWQGFYMTLEKELNEGDWGYVANPNGGFWGFWWHWRDIASYPNIDLYLQFEQGNLCIKAYDKDGGKSGIKLSNRIIAIANEKRAPVCKPARRRRGTTMTLAWVNWHDTDMLELSHVMKRLKETEKFIDDLCTII